MKSISFVTSAQPSSNPRMLKEIKSLYLNGYSINVVWSPISTWADDFDQIIFKEYTNIKWVKAGYHAKTEPIGFYFARIRKKYWYIFYTLFGNLFNAAIKSQVLYSQELTKLAKRQKSNLFIGHNLGALPAIVKAAKKYDTKCVFDFEDFHRGENLEGSIQMKIVKDVESKYIPFVNSITTASSLITNVYETIFPSQKFTTINNCFPLSYSLNKNTILHTDQLKLFWFSQFIGKKRGLETVLLAMSNFPKGSISLTLLGSLSKENKIYFENLLTNLGLDSNQLIFVDSLKESEITELASLHHIGLCSEYAHIQNRDLCLTNKLFIYLLAGNAILMTDTKAQQAFYVENPNVGILYKQEKAESLVAALKFYFDNPRILNLHRKNSLQLARVKYNWDIEQQVFLSNVKKVLNLYQY